MAKRQISEEKRRAALKDRVTLPALLAELEKLRRRRKFLEATVKAQSKYNGLQCFIILQVGATPGCTQEKLVLQFESQPETISQSVEVLVIKGLILDNKKDGRRGSILSLTPAGVAARAKIIRTTERVFENE